MTQPLSQGISDTLLESFDFSQIYSILRTGVAGLLKPDTHLVGITTGGVWLAENLHQDLKVSTPLGLVSSMLHRDDFASKGISNQPQTKLPFQVEGAHIILIDDVLHTGRTIRAVINELYDYGRPRGVDLAVLIDRAGRELPICATFAANSCELSANQLIHLRKNSQGQFYIDIKEK